MLKEMIAPDSVIYVPQVSGWREAVDIAASPLLEHGDIRESYVDAIKSSIDSPGGTYIDLGGGIALAHARPETGVIRSALSVLRVGKSFLLADDEQHPIEVLFCLGAKDSDSHIDMMKNLAELLTNDDKRQALMRAKDKETLRAALA